MYGGMRLDEVTNEEREDAQGHEPGTTQDFE